LTALVLVLTQKIGPRFDETRADFFNQILTLAQRPTP